jgi:hypothetical protein
MNNLTSNIHIGLNCRISFQIRPTHSTLVTHVEISPTSDEYLLLCSLHVVSLVNAGRKTDREHQVQLLPNVETKIWMYSVDPFLKG